jgi:hypothetical protein
MSEGLKLVLDPEEAPVELVRSADGKSGYAVLSPLKKTTPQSEPQWASNIDTEGELSAGSKDKNIEIAPKLRMYGRDEEDFREVQLALEQKLDKMRVEGGTLRLYYPDGSWIDYEVRAVAGGERLFDNSFIANRRTEDEVVFICAPFGEGEEYLAGEFSGSDRVLEGEIADVKGSALALARVELTSPDADAWELLWGRDSRSYTGESTALAFYKAGELTLLGGAKTGTRTIEGKSGVPVVKQVLNPNWTAQLSTDLSTGEHLTHVGVFEVYAWIDMPTANKGEVGVFFEYGIDDLQDRTSLAPVYFDADDQLEGRVVRVTLGQVFLPARDEPRWEGRVVTRSSFAGDEADVLALGFRPLAEGSGRVSITPTLNQPAALLTRDEFNGKAGALNGQTIAGAASVTGPTSAGTGAVKSISGGVAWSDPGSITEPGGTAAKARLSSPGSETSDYLMAAGFGFEFPETAQVEGIQFEARLAQAENEFGAVIDKFVQAVKGGAVQAANRARGIAAWPLESAYVSFGGPTDLFGTTWAYTDLNAADFGLAIAAVVYHLGSTAAGTAMIDHVRCTVYWTDGEGQKWVTSGDATDFSVETAGHTAQRSQNQDANTLVGRYAEAGTTAAADVVVGINATHTTLGGEGLLLQGAFAHYVDEKNFLYLSCAAERSGSGVTGAVTLWKSVAGTVLGIGTATIPETTEWHSVRLQVDRRGRFFCWVSYVESGIPRLLLLGQDSDLATGGTLASGTSGFLDWCFGTLTTTRSYDQFVVWIPPLQAVLYQGLGLRLKSDGVDRQGPNGAWAPVTPEGDYVKLAPAGREGRKNRLVFIASPNDPDTMAVGFPTELKAAVYVTPRYRGVPDAA